METIDLTIWAIPEHSLPSKQFSSGDGVHFDMSFSEDGSLVACAGGTKGISVWKTSTGDRLAQLTSKSNRNPMFSFDIDYLASCNANLCEVWALPTGILLHCIKWPEKYSGDLAKSIIWGKSDKKLAVLTYAFLRVWEIDSGDNNDNYVFFSGELPLDIQVGRADRLIVYSCRIEKKRYTHLYATDVQERRRIAEIPLDSDRIPIISQDGKWLLNRARGQKAIYQIWDLTTGQCQSEFSDSRGSSPLKLAFFMQSTLCLVHQSSDTIQLRDLHSGQLVKLITADRLVRIRRSDATDILAVICKLDGDKPYRVMFINIFSGSILGYFDGHIGYSSVISPSGRWFASVIDHNYIVDRSHSPGIGTVLLIDLAAIEN